MNNPNDGSPYQTYSAGAPNNNDNYDLQTKAAKDEQEKASKAPDNLPFPLQTIIDDIGNVFVKMVGIKDKFKRAKTGANPRKIEKIKEIENQIDEINKQIFKLTDKLHDIKS